MKPLTLFLIVFTAGILAILGAKAVEGQQPLCGNDLLTPVPCATPTATVTPAPTATAVPTATPIPLPVVLPVVRLYQEASCGLPLVKADVIGGNGLWRVAITKNGNIVQSLDGFGGLTSIYTEATSPGTLYKAFAFARETAPVFIIGQFYDGPTPYVLPAAGVLPCAAPTVAPVAPTAALSVPQQVSTAVAALQPLPTVGPSVGVIRAPNTGSGGLLR